MADRTEKRGRTGAPRWLAALPVALLLAPWASMVEAGVPGPVNTPPDPQIQGRGESFPMNDPRYRPSPSPMHGALAHNLWTNMSPTVNTPTPLFLDNSLAIFDEKRDVVLAIGVEFDIEIWALHPSNKTWANWTPSGSPAPPSRGGSVVVRSIDHDRILLFGGGKSVGGNLVLLNDSWLLDIGNRTWSNVTGGAAPTRRYTAASTHYPEGDLAIINGGCDQFAGNAVCIRNPQDTWSFDFNTNSWKRLRIGEGPSGRSGHSLAYDPGTKRILTFSGFEGAPPPGNIPTDTWMYDVAANLWTRLFPSKTPVGRWGYGFNFDETANRFIMFGGWGANFKATNETWTFNWTAGQWLQMRPALLPNPREDALMCYDSLRGLNWMYGGGIGDTSIRFDDVWTYDLGNISSRPLNLTATAGANRVELIWDPPIDTGDGPIHDYSILRGLSTGPIQPIGTSGNRTFYNDTTVSGGVRYRYAVTARNAYGDSATSAPASALPLGAPGPPGNTAISVGDAEVILSWAPPTNDGGSPVTGYRVYRGLQPGQYSSNVSVGNVSAHVDGGLQNGRTYYYAVAAINAVGEGAVSAEVSATPRSPPVKPAVVGTIPRPGEVDIGLESQIAILFNVGMEPSSTLAALEIVPATAGSGIVNGTLLTWTPGSSLAWNTSYTVTVGAGAKSNESELLGAPYTFGFRTVAKLVNVTGRITEGPGDPVAGAMVEGYDAATSTLQATATTAEDGSYLLRLEDGGSYSLEVTLPNGTKKRSEVFIVDGDRKVDMHIATRIAPVPRWSLDWLVVVIGLAGTLSALAIAGWLGGEAVKWMLLVIPIIIYSRIHRDKVLDHFVRGQIYGHIKTNPGATFTEISQVLGISNGVLTHHLYTLEKMEFVRSEREGRWKRFYPKDAPKTKQGIMVSSLQKHILDTIRREPGISQSELASRLGTKRQNVHYNVQKLVQTGYVKLEGFGFRKRCLPLERLEEPGSLDPTPPIKTTLPRKAEPTDQSRAIASAPAKGFESYPGLEQPAKRP